MRFCLEVLAGLLAGMVILSTVLVWRLSAGPVNLPFLTETVEDALNQSGLPLRFRVKDTVMTWAGWDRAIDFVARDVEIRQGQGETPLAVLPQISVGLSLAALADGQIAPKTLEILSPRGFVVRDAQGQMSLAVEPETDTPAAEETTELQSVLAMLEGFNRAPGEAQDPLGYLERINVVGASGTFRDRKLKQSWRFRDGDLSLRRGETGLTIAVSSRVQRDTHEASFTLETSRLFASDVMTLEVAVRDTDMRILQPLMPELASAHEVLGRIDLIAEASVRSDGMPVSWELDARMSQGARVQSNGLVSAPDVGSFSAQLEVSGIRPPRFSTVSGAHDALRVLDGTLHANAHVTGTLDWPAHAVDDLTGTVRVTGGQGVLDLKSLLGHPDQRRLDYDSITLAAQIRDNGRRIDLNEATLVFPDVTVEGSGRLQTNGVEGVTVALDVGLTDFNMEHLERYWPYGVGQDARDWVVQNIPSGPVPEANVQLVGRVVDRGFGIDSFGGRIALQDAVVDYFKPLPPARGVSGEARFGLGRFDIDIRSGYVGRAKMRAGKVAITGLDNGNEAIDISLDLQSPLRDALDLVDHEPLRLVSGIGFDTANVSGTAKGEVRFQFPLLKEMDADMVRVRAETTVDGLALKDAFKGMTARGNGLKLAVDNDGFDVSGNVRVDGIPLRATWHENFGDDRALRKQLTASGTLSENDLYRLGYNVIPYLGGESDLSLDHRTYRDGRQELSLQVDMKDARLVVPHLNWIKPQTFPAHLELESRWVDGQPMVIAPIRFEGDTMAADLSITLGPDREAIEAAEIKRLRLNGGALKGRLSRRDGGTWVADVEGTRFDAGGVLDLLSQADDLDTERGQPFRLSAKFDEVYAYPSRQLGNVRLAVRHDGRNTEFFDLSAQARDGTPLAIRYEWAGGGYALEGRTEKLGSVLKSVNAYTNMEGGKAVLTGHSTSADAPLEGRLDVEEFKLVNPPVMGKLLEFVSVTGTLSSLTTDSLPFAKMEGDFKLTKDHLEIVQSRAFSPSIGVSLKGLYDRRAGVLDMNGTVVPAYTLNKVLNIIPVVGWLLTGGEDSGFFGANFTLRGPMDMPDIVVNPLSVLTPGALRRIFDIVPEEGEDVPSPGPRSQR